MDDYIYIYIYIHIYIYIFAQHFRHFRNFCIDHCPSFTDFRFYLTVSV